MHILWPVTDNWPSSISRREGMASHSVNWNFFGLAIEPHTRSNHDNSPCLIRFVPEPAQNHARTDETVPLLLAAQAWIQTEPPKCHRHREGKKHMVWPLAYRASTLTIKLLSHQSTCDKNMVTGSAQWWAHWRLRLYSLLLEVWFEILGYSASVRAF